MKKRTWLRRGIFVIVLGALLIDLPRIPLKIHWQDFRFEREVGPFGLDFTLFGKPIKKSFPTKLGLDLAGGTHLLLRADMSDIPGEDRETALSAARNVIERRVNFYGLTEPVVQEARSGDTFRILVELPGVKDVDQAVALIGQTAKLEFRELAGPEATQAAFPTLGNTIETGIAGRDLKTARLDFDPNSGKPVVAFEFNPEGAEKFKVLTERLIGKPLPIFLDGLPLSWPTVQDVISDKGTISGEFTTTQAKNLALQLSAGALPVPVEIEEQKTIGATLGQESIRKSLRAAGLGLLVVALFMIGFYGRLGFLANLALVIYGLLSLAIFKLVPVTLTLPGIAGFFLSIGMAVDSNILIFERARQERRAGRPARVAVELGFGRAWDAIRDANVCTLIVCFVLFNPFNWSFLNTSGLVRGFAATLFIGLAVSLFTGVVVTRELIRRFYHD